MDMFLHAHVFGSRETQVSQAGWPAAAATGLMAGAIVHTALQGVQQEPELNSFLKEYKQQFVIVC